MCFTPMKAMRNPIDLILIFSLFTLATSRNQNHIEKGSSLSVEDKDYSAIITSPDNSFTCGFYRVGTNAYGFGIWFTNSRNRTIAWMANRDKPVNGKGSRISLRGDGAMVLTDVDGSVVWETNTSSTATQRAELLNSGNLVLKDPSGKILWQSFDFPTDTLLPSQTFTKSNKLVSSLRSGSYASGYFNLYFDSDNVLRLVYDGPDISSIYWPNPDLTIYANGRTNYNSSRFAFLDDMGRIFSSDQLQINATDMGFGIKRRLTLDYDGNLRLYSLNNLTGSWVVSWMALQHQCLVHGLCGRNGICAYGRGAKCTCPPGYEVIDSSDWSKGCKPKFKISCSNPQQVKFKFVELLHSDYYGFDLNTTHNSFNDCKEMCSKDCRCEAFNYRIMGEGTCFLKSALFNGFHGPNSPSRIHLKMPVTVETSKYAVPHGSNVICRSNDSESLPGFASMYNIAQKKVRWAYLYSFASTIGAIEILLFVIGFLIFRRHEVPGTVEDGYRMIFSQFRRFSYSELKKATKRFKQELGRGGSGAVYKGVLEDEREVAVKRLGDASQGEQEFWAEVSTIGKMNHMNLVRMWGFCLERRHRLLVYEYVENSSLDKHLFSTSCLGWKQRFKVAIGTAKALAYLHHECLEWVIHCDVKPENILLDADFEAKVADFGLAKLNQRGGPGMEFSHIRGTKGYMAPEWAMNLPITAKVDVYSYGVVILEMVRGIRLSNWVLVEGEDEEQEVELTRFVRIAKRKSQSQSGEESWVEDMVDPRLTGRFSRKQAAALVMTGLSCIEEDRSKRPTMASVVQVLVECEDESQISTAVEGSTEIHDE